MIATTDPNPEVDGKGLQLLTDNGVKVQTNILKEQGDDLIKYFKVNHLQKRPYIILKIVKSKDNFIGKTGKNRFVYCLSQRNQYKTRRCKSYPER